MTIVGYDPPRTPEGCSCRCHVGVKFTFGSCCLHAPIFGPPVYRWTLEELRELEREYEAYRVKEGSGSRFETRSFLAWLNSLGRDT